MEKSPPSEYQYKEVPLTPEVAREHILNYLRAHQAPVKRRELVKYAEQQHVNGGGMIKGDPTSSVKKALNGLEDEKIIIRGPIVGSRKT
jgi:hypothetical protein